MPSIAICSTGFITFVVIVSLGKIPTSLSLTQTDLSVFTDLESQIEVLGMTDEAVYSHTTLVCGTYAPSNIGLLYFWYVHDSSIPVTQRFRSGHLIQSNGRVFFDNARGTNLAILGLSFADSGRYRCEIQGVDSTTMESASDSLSLTLILLIRLEVISSSVSTFNDSEYVRLGCDMSGYIRPDSDFFWIINGQVTTSTTGSSKYSVTYSNGSHVAQFGGESTVPSRVSWLTVFHVDLEDADVQYSCVINNTEHRSNMMLVVKKASVPSGYPTGMTATAISSTSVRVNWNMLEESERNGNITHFEIILTPSLLAVASFPIPTISVNTLWKSREADIIGLEEFTEYDVTIRAFTVVGPGPFSPASLVVTLEDVPTGVPQRIRAIPISPSAITVSWGPIPERDKNGIIVEYEVEYSQTSFHGVPSSQSVHTNTSNSVLLENLEEFVEYSVRVRAYTVVGSGPFSPVAMATTEEAKPSSSPRIASLVSFNSSALGIAWIPPVQLHINGVLRHYIVKYCTQTVTTENGSGHSPVNPDTTLPSSGSDEPIVCKSVSVSGNVTRMIVNKLDGNTVHIVSVAAVTVAEGPAAIDSILTGDTLIGLQPMSPVKLGPNFVVSQVDVSCTVSSTVNQGIDSTFAWEWSVPNDDRFNEVTDVDSRTSTLTIRNLRHGDEGHYLCGLFLSGWEGISVNTIATKLQLTYEIVAITPSVLVARNETSINLVCSFYGYLPANTLSWYYQIDLEMGQTKQVREIIVGITQILDQAHSSQTGGEQPEPGLRSILTLASLTEDNAGKYFCAFPTDLSINASIEVVVESMVDPIDPVDKGIVIVVVVAIIILILIVSCTLAIGAEILIKSKESKKYSLEEHDTTTDSIQETQWDSGHEGASSAESFSDGLVLTASEALPLPKYVNVPIRSVPVRNGDTPVRGSDRNVETAINIQPANLRQIPISDVVEDVSQSLSSQSSLDTPWIHTSSEIMSNGWTNTQMMRNTAQCACCHVNPVQIRNRLPESRANSKPPKHVSFNLPPLEISQTNETHRVRLPEDVSRLEELPSGMIQSPAVGEIPRFTVQCPGSLFPVYLGDADEESVDEPNSPVFSPFLGTYV